MHAVQHPSTRKADGSGSSSASLRALRCVSVAFPLRWAEAVLRRSLGSAQVALKSSLIKSSPHLPSLALHLALVPEKLLSVVEELMDEAVALLVNLAADEAAACLILAEDSFMAVALRAFKHKNTGMLKARHSDSSSLELEGTFQLLMEEIAKHEVLVEVLGILAALDCPSPEAVMLLSLLALDPPAAALLPSSKAQRSRDAESDLIRSSSQAVHGSGAWEERGSHAKRAKCQAEELVDLILTVLTPVDPGFSMNFDAF
eukprot:Skav221499  [mRNA]  locus=scaffold2743:27849:33186:- [translate_table: standard]